MIGIIIAVAALIGAGVGVYFVFIKKKSSDAPVAASTGWRFQYSTGVGGTPEDFDFPNSDGVHYCVRTPPPLTEGQTVTIRFTISGTGTLRPVQGATATLSLYIQRYGDTMTGVGQYQQYRYWHTGVALSNGELSLSAVLNGDQWTDVFGQSGSGFPSQFQLCLAQAGAIGFVFGDPGAGATGHGVYADGGVHFHLNEFSVS